MSAGQSLAIQTRRLVAGQQIGACGRPIAYNSVGICASVSDMEMFNRSDLVAD